MAGGGDQHVVLDAHADAAKLLRHRMGDLGRLRLVFLLQLLGGDDAEAIAALPLLVLAVLAQRIRHRLALGIDVQAGLDGEDHAGLERARGAVEAIVADVVHVHAEPVSGAVHVELTVVVHGQRVGHATGQELQIDEPLGQHAPRSVVDDLVLHAGLRGVDARQLRAQDDLVDGALRTGEAAAHRKRACDVGRHVAVLTAGVDQQQVAGLHAPRVLDIVQDARVRAGGDDGRVGVARRAVDAEHVLERRLHLVLVHARLRIPHRLRVAVAADRARAAKPHELGVGLAQTEIVQQRPGVLDPHRRREPAGARRPQLGHEARDARVECGVAEPVIQDGAVDRVLPELRVQLVDRVGGVRAVGRDGALGPGATTVPDLHLAVARPDEEHEALLGMRRIDHRDRVGLVEAREEEEVARLPELVMHVAVAEALDTAGDDGEAVAERGGEALASLEKGCEIRTHVPLIP